MTDETEDGTLVHRSPDQPESKALNSVLELTGAVAGLVVLVAPDGELNFSFRVGAEAPATAIASLLCGADCFMRYVADKMQAENKNTGTHH